MREGAGPILIGRNSPAETFAVAAAGVAGACFVIDLRRDARRLELHQAVPPGGRHVSQVRLATRVTVEEELLEVA